MAIEQAIFRRSELLLGDEAMNLIAEKRVIIFGTEKCMCPKAKNGPGDPNLLNHEWCSSKAQINGTLSHITAIFGFMLTGLIIQDAVNA